MSIIYPFKTVIERYCPCVGHNVAVEIITHKEGNKLSNCLNEHKCVDKQEKLCSTVKNEMY